MTFNALLRALRRRWPMVVAGVLVGLVAAGTVTLLLPRSYASTASVYVTATDSSVSSPNAYQGSLFSQQKVKSYSEIVVSDRVLQPVVDQYALGPTTDFADHVVVAAESDSTVLRITVDDASPQRAAEIANAVSARFIQVVAELERPRIPGTPPAVDVAVIDQATPDEEAVSPRPFLNLAVGLVLGVVLGVTAAVLRTAYDTSLRTVPELTEATGAPALGALPLDSGLKAGQPVSGAPQGGYGEAVRRVRTNLLFADVDEPPALITITSSTSGEGKTTLVHALAAVLAPTSRVAVLEGDLRRPAAAERLGLVAGVGLTDVLTRRTTLEEAIQHWGPGVDVLPAGSTPPNPSELLSSRQMQDVLDRLRGTYDVVLVDAPPLGPVADAAILASRTDGALLLCRAGATGREQLFASTDSLRAVGARLFGVILTMTAPTKRDGYDDYRAAPPGQAAPPERAAHAAGTGPQSVVDVRPSPSPARVAVSARPSPGRRAAETDAPTQETRREAWRLPPGGAHAGPPAGEARRVNGHGPLDPSRG